MVFPTRLVTSELRDGACRILSYPGIGVCPGGLGQRAEGVRAPGLAERCRRTLSDRGMGVAECSDQDVHGRGSSDLAKRFGGRLADGVSRIHRKGSRERLHGGFAPELSERVGRGLANEGALILEQRLDQRRDGVLAPGPSQSGRSGFPNGGRRIRRNGRGQVDDCFGPADSPERDGRARPRRRLVLLRQGSSQLPEGRRLGQPP